VRRKYHEQSLKSRSRLPFRDALRVNKKNIIHEEHEGAQRLVIQNHTPSVILARVCSRPLPTPSCLVEICFSLVATKKTDDSTDDTDNSSSFCCRPYGSVVYNKFLNEKIFT